MSSAFKNRNKGTPASLELSITNDSVSTPQTEALSMQNHDVFLDVKPVSESAEDVGVAGRYWVEIPASTSRRLLADIALESFHRTIPVSCPEAFEITLLDAVSGRKMIPTYVEIDQVFGCKKVRHL
jgi:hypothetical protein